jgi:hypothetical protein
MDVPQLSSQVHNPFYVPPSPVALEAHIDHDNTADDCSAASKTVASYQ